MWHLRLAARETNAGAAYVLHCLLRVVARKTWWSTFSEVCSYQQAGEASVARSATRGVRALLLLHCLLSECGVLIHLAMTDHDSAQGRILLMQGVFTRFPTLLADALYTIQMTTGYPLLITSLLMLKALTDF